MIDFKVKICGVRTPQDVAACTVAGADCVGLNFYPKSVRYLDPNSSAAESVNEQAVRDGLVRVGLFVNEPPERIVRVVERFRLDAVQLHGDESPETATQLLADGRLETQNILRAVRLPTTPLTPVEIQTAIAPWNELPVTLLFDADAGTQFGGGGKQLHWPSLAAWSEKYAASLAHPAWILAGGLTCANVAEACQVSGASRVDVASGVESFKGQKSPEQIREFVHQYKQRGVDAER